MRVALRLNCDCCVEAEKDACVNITVRLGRVLGLSLQLLPQELLLCGQVLFNEAVLAHLLPYLAHTHTQRRFTVSPPFYL